MEENKVPTQAAIIGFCLSFMAYFWTLNSGTIVQWIINFVIAGAIAAGAFFGAKQLG